jgi:hypothetical protein
MWEDHHRGEKT